MISSYWPILAVHLISVILWVGGLSYISLLLPVALDSMEEKARLTLWVNILDASFPWAWGCVIALLASGFALFGLGGGLKNVSTGDYIMAVTGVLMIAIFKFIYLSPLRHLRRGVEEGRWKVARYALGTLHLLFRTMLVLSIVSVSSAVAA